MLEAIARIKGWTADLSYEQFIADRMLIDAVERNLFIIGEASNQVPDEQRSRHPEIVWIDIRGMRNVLGHQYFESSLSVVWATVRSDLPELERALKAWIDSEP